jgi:hypothetical protein
MKGFVSNFTINDVVCWKKDITNSSYLSHDKKLKKYAVQKVLIEQKAWNDLGDGTGAKEVIPKFTYYLVGQWSEFWAVDEDVISPEEARKLIQDMAYKI